MREMEVQEAKNEFPELEIGEAYRRWKKIRGQNAVLLQTSDETIEKTKDILKRETGRKPCTQNDCDGTMELEGICGGCVEGRLGWKSKWICEKCLHRELSKKEYFEYLKELTKNA